jgi:hypothetical protein
MDTSRVEVEPARLACHGSLITSGGFIGAHSLRSPSA